MSKEPVVTKEPVDVSKYVKEIELAAKGQGAGMDMMSSRNKPFYRLMACGVMAIIDTLKK